MEAGTCRSCHAKVYWVRTPAGKLMPVDAQSETRLVVGEDGLARVVATWRSHFATCPHADQHRKPKP